MIFKRTHFHIVLIYLIFVSACQGGWTKAKIISNVDEVIIGDNIDVRIEGLIPGESYKVHLQLVAADHQMYSETKFTADKFGVIDIDKDWSEGEYFKGPDSLGLFYTLLQDEAPSYLKDVQVEKDETFFVFQVSKNKKQLALKKIRRILDAENKDYFSINDMTYKIDIHDVPENNTLVILLGGSEGNNYAFNEMAMLLAAKGYSTAAVSYFGGDYQSKNLIRIPLELIDESRALIAEKIGEKKILVLIGASRGAELSLLYASHRKEVNGVIAIAPSSNIFPGVSYEMEPAWTMNTDTFPHVYMNHAKADKDMYGRNVWVHEYEKALENAPSETEIEVENIQGDILLISGRNDLVWPAAFMADQLHKRALSKNFKFELLNVQHEGAGHFLLPYAYGTELYENEEIALGGYPRENAYAKLDTWQRILAYLEKHHSKSALRH